MKWTHYLLTLTVACADNSDKPDPGGGSPSTDDTATPDDTASVDLGCPEDVAIFEARVWNPVLDTYCFGCHQEEGPAAGTRMVFDPDDMLHNLRAAARVSDLLLLKPTGLHEDGHGGGDLVTPDSMAWEALAFWQDWTNGICDDEEEACEDVATARRLWRLDHGQYQRTIEDLLGISTDLGRHLAPDTQVDGYANDSEALLVSGLLADQYRSAAEDLASVADIAGMLDCVPEEGANTQCAATFIEAFGTRAFRRPLAADELSTYLGLWAEIAEDDGFFEGLRWVIAGMLQSPNFLYRSELGVVAGSGNFTLTDWEIASELSYLIWGTMPDEELFALAAAGELHTGEQIESAAARLLADDRALETTANFVEAWLQLGRIETISRIDLQGELEDAMVEQTRETVKDVAGSGGTLADLVTGRETYLPDALATHYGLESGGWVEQDGEQYGGLLTHGSLLTVYALSDSSSPVHRGVVVRERMLCEELPPPPANLDTSPPATDAAGTTREKYEIHSSLPECASCHALIDPIGFGFEHYDHLGRWRDEELGQPIDATGDVDGVAFDGAQDLGSLLVDDDRFAACFVESWRRWGMGEEACAEPVSGVGLTDPLVELTSRVAFQHRTGNEAGLDTRAVGERLNGDAITVVADEYGEVLPGGATGGVEFTLIDTTVWPTGFCSDGTVTNTTTEPVTWEVRAEILGEITSIWSANYTEDGDDHVFTGVEWNAELPAFGSTTFGFCGTR